jgi:hypothetical protein
MGIFLSTALAGVGSSLHINLGDVPTWLGVIAASVAAIFVYLQLRGQQVEIARQTRLLERQQADLIDRLGPRPMNDIRQFGVEVENRSARPIHNVAARMMFFPQPELRLPVSTAEHRRLQPGEPEDPGPPEMPKWPSAQPGWKTVFMSTEAAPAPSAWARNSAWPAVDLVRPDGRALFVFEVPGPYFSELRALVRLTDDVGLHWQIDENLHLLKLEDRDW